MSRGRKTSNTEIPVHILGDQQSPTDGFVTSPTGEIVSDEGVWEGEEPMMLPPTVSTYSHRNYYIPSPPDQKSLKTELTDALQKAKEALDEAKQSNTPGHDASTVADVVVEPDTLNSTKITSDNQGWYELQGMHILDVVTLAIRAAKIYYTAHDQPERLIAIKSERRIRQELLLVMDTLKRWATRNFAGGLREEERVLMQDWIVGVEQMLEREAEIERHEKEERKGWTWMEGDWSGKECERERLFLQSLSQETCDIPLWEATSPPDQLPQSFLERLADGRLLIQLHNQAVKKSSRHFGEIKTFHTDIAKPYRRAENMRFWVKAAELRWEIKLEVDVTGIVQASGDGAWKGFEAALMQWCRTVRQELTKDFKGANSHHRGSSWVVL